MTHVPLLIPGLSKSRCPAGCCCKRATRVDRSRPCNVSDSVAGTQQRRIRLPLTCFLHLPCHTLAVVFFIIYFTHFFSSFLNKQTMLSADPFGYCCVYFIYLVKICLGPLRKGDQIINKPRSLDCAHSIGTSKRH